MFRKTLFTLTAVVALGTASTAMAMHGGGGGGGGGGGLGGGHGWGGGAGMHSGGGGWGGGPGLKCHADDACNDYGANDGRAGSGWAGRTAWNRDRFHDHFHNRFRNRNFFAFGFGGPYYDTAYNSCWAQVPSYYGWQWVYVCGDYPYGY